MDLNVIVQLFILLNPVESLPFLASAYKQNLNIKSIAFKSTLTAYFIAIIITMSGSLLFSLMGISIDSFKIAGGIILFLLSLRMIWPNERKSKISEFDTYTSLIATPMLTGPATISYIIIKTFEIGRLSMIYSTTAVFILVAVFFMFSNLIISKINLRVIDIISRILALFITAFAVELIISGINNLI